MEREPLHVEMRRAREETGVSLSDFYESTRIRMELLEALEQGQYDMLPTPYIRLFLRTYAEKVGLDPEYVLKRYEEEVQPGKGRRAVDTTQKPSVEPPQKPPPDAPSDVPERTPAEDSQPPPEVPEKRPMKQTRVPPVVQTREPSTERSRKPLIKILEKSPTRIPWRGAIATLMVVIVGIVAIMMGGSDREPDDLDAGPVVERIEPEAGDAGPIDSSAVEDTPSVSEAAVSPLEEEVEGSAGPSAEPVEPEVAAPGSLLTLVAQARDSTWARIDGDGRLLFTGILAAGEKRTWTAADTFAVISGKPFGIRFVFQGEPVPSDTLPSIGVLHLGFGREGFRVQKPR